MVGSDRIGQVLRTEACVRVPRRRGGQGRISREQGPLPCFGADKDIAQA